MSKKKRKVTRTTAQERDLKLLNRIASYMYGERWQSDLAVDLDLNTRTVRSWVQMRSNITPTIWRGVDKLLDYHINSGAGIRAAMDKRIATLAED